MTIGTYGPPSIPGVSAVFKWTPKYYNQHFEAVNGASIDIALSPYPQHEFELTYNFMRELSDTWSPGNTLGPYAEFMQVQAFLAQMRGTGGRFGFTNPKDQYFDAQSGQGAGLGNTLIKGDGTTTAFTIARQIGARNVATAIDPPYNSSVINIPLEPVGEVNTVSAVYWGTSLQSGGSYSIAHAYPGANQIIFGSPPPANTPIWITMSYYYYCRMVDDSEVFQSWADGHWDSTTLKFQSCVAGS